MFPALQQYLPHNMFFKSLLISFAVFDLPGRFMLINGPSMQPTLNEDLDAHMSDVIWIDKIPPDQIKQGDVAVFTSPIEPDRKLVKRVIALGQSWVLSRYTQTPVYVPAGHCWLEGDNADNSHDSNVLGPIPLGLLHGRSTLRLYPWDTECLKRDEERAKLRLFDINNPYAQIDSQLASLTGNEKIEAEAAAEIKKQLIQAQFYGMDYASKQAFINATSHDPNQLSSNTTFHHQHTGISDDSDSSDNNDIIHNVVDNISSSIQNTINSNV